MLQDDRDWRRLIQILRGLERIEIAQFLAQAVQEMVDDDASAEEIAEICSSLCRKLGTTAEDLRRALH